MVEGVRGRKGKKEGGRVRERKSKKDEGRES